MSQMASAQTIPRVWREAAAAKAANACDTRGARWSGGGTLSAGKVGRRSGPARNERCGTSKQGPCVLAACLPPHGQRAGRLASRKSGQLASQFVSRHRLDRSFATMPVSRLGTRTSDATNVCHEVLETCTRGHARSAFSDFSTVKYHGSPKRRVTALQV